MEKDSTVQILQMISEVTHFLNINLGKDYDGEITEEYFEEMITKAREIDPRSPFFWVRDNKERFTPEMIEYIQSIYNREI